MFVPRYQAIPAAFSAAECSTQTPFYPSCLRLQRWLSPTTSPMQTKLLMGVLTPLPSAEVIVIRLKLACSDQCLDVKHYFAKMSFIDLATLALHRRNEMETRIKSFVSKCDRAIEDILKLKLEAQGFVHQLNCDPSELKERFLNCMKTLDEYNYLITDFNLSMAKFEEMKGTVDNMPVHDITSKSMMTPTPVYNILRPTNNIMDMLSEPVPSTSRTCPNFCPLEHKSQRRKISKEEQTLIQFSSTSCSSESMPSKNEVVKEEKEVQCQLTEGVRKLSITEPIFASPSSPQFELCNLPAQTILETDHAYPATIMNIDGPSVWVITDDPEAACRLMYDMTCYYKANHIELTLEQIRSLTYCAYYDDDSESYYRGLFIRVTEEDENVAEVFLVDTGEVHCGSCAALQPLAARFCVQPPFARCCHLAGVDMLSCNDKELIEKQEQFLSQYIGKNYTIEVDDNTSESLGVYVVLENNETLNELLIKNGLACATPEKAQSLGSRGSAAAAAPANPAALTTGPPELSTALSDSQFDLDCPEFEDPLEAVTLIACLTHPAYTAALTTGPPELSTALSDSQFDLDCPEFEDPLEAVTGYVNRDEAEICKHYKGGPEKTCFKGARCKKRHVLLHPDGWTKDRVEVTAKCLSLPLPAPGTWLRALVTVLGKVLRSFIPRVLYNKDSVEMTAKCLSLPLPAPGTWLRALVTCVAHFDHLFVQILKEKGALECRYNKDRVEVTAKCLSLPLPAPGTWLRALVTCVAHFDRLFVQILKEKGALEEDEPLPDFGVILPPMTLEALIRDMNSPATRTAYKPLKIMPAEGELVAALYPCDNQWYRARVVTVSRADQNVEVQYIDYGNKVWIKEDCVRELEPRFTALPAQAVRCLLAGVSARSHDSKQWAAAKQQLARLAQDRTLDVRVIARGYDEITVEMLDEQGFSIAEQLAATNLVDISEFAVQPDSYQPTQIVVP
ncbi:tudor domain-containing protein [Phthorimaea operculella]|nr:tudor domain-containing protein [Phthorimaea operculella]